MMNLQRTAKSRTYTYKELIDSLVLDVVERGCKEFWELVQQLPGVPPVEVRESLYRIGTNNVLPQTFLTLIDMNRAPRSRHPANDWSKRLPPPHPLAFDWRFSEKTAAKLLDLALDLARPPKTIVFLGTPTLYLLAARRGFPSRVVLIDRNSALPNFLPQLPTRATIRIQDVRTPSYVHEYADTIVIDPPWYEREIKSFLWMAANICQLDGHILVSLPPIGTRPGIIMERNRLLRWATSIGLEVLGINKLALSYLTPHFEYNALQATGFHSVASEWRRGDLLVLGKQMALPRKRPKSRSPGDNWSEFRINCVSVWVRLGNSRSFRNPKLVSVVPGDVLPTVSRRDRRRAIVDVWTSGNRVFACKGHNIFAAILGALELGKSPEAMVTGLIKRQLVSEERKLLFSAVDQVAKIMSYNQKVWK